MRCWFGRHKWLLQSKEYILTLTNHLRHNRKSHLFSYHYECQRCGKKEDVTVNDLDEFRRLKKVNKKGK